MKRKGILAVGILAVLYGVYFSLAFKGEENTDPKNLKLKEAFKSQFYIGTALNARQIAGEVPEAIRVMKAHFNAIVAENCMKSGRIQPREGEFRFELADQFVSFGGENDMLIMAIR